MNTPSPTVLCVDDDPEVLGVLKEYLTAQGFHVVTATDGVEAMFEAQRALPRAVILDLSMPRLGGLAALDRIQRLLPGVLFILISGHPQALEVVTEAEIKIARAFCKPLDLVAVLGALAQAGVVPPERRPEPSPQDLDAGGTEFSRRRVLVVDDEPDVREVLVEYLQGKEFEVLGAASGREALGRISEFRPHIVLLDISMPGLSGVETLQRIKDLAAETVVVMVSGQGDEAIARQTLALGAADYVMKPVDFAYLNSVLDTHRLTGSF